MLIVYFYALLLFVVLIVSVKAVEIVKGFFTLNELMTLKLEEIQGTDHMYDIQRTLRCCQDYKSVKSNNLNSLTGSCCGKKNNEVCASINEVFMKPCLPEMIVAERKKLYVAGIVTGFQAISLICNAIISIILYFSKVRQSLKNTKTETN